ncbi:MAG: hypothetical protein ABSF71_16770 [Terriglobia bacterium]|jgi:hypothetical protein
MPSTGNFDLVAEITQAKLNELLQAAYQSSKIPHSVNVPAGTSFGPYQLSDGVVQISSNGLALVMAPPTGVQITLPSQTGVQIANPPVSSLTTFNFTANILVTLPLGQLPDPVVKVGLITDGLPRGNVSVNLTSNPVPAVTPALINEYVDQEYANGTIPNTVSQPGVSFGPFTADAYLEVFNSQSDPTKAITTTTVAGGVEVDIPVHLRLSNLQPTGASPIGVGATLAITVPLVTASDSITAKFSAATVTVKNYGAWPVEPEQSNYNTDKAGATFSGINLDNLLQAQLTAYATQFARALPDQTFFIPTQAEIETFIGNQVYQSLLTTGNIGVWTPNPPPGSPVTVRDVTPRALADAAALGINSNAGSDPSVWINFIPAGRDFAIAVNGSIVTQSVNDAVQTKFGKLPTTLHNINGHDVELKSVNPSLQEGSIHLEGDVTVIDAILGSIDVDASYSADVGLTWQNRADGTQMVQPVTLNSSVGLSTLAWIISLLLGFITGGLVGGIITVVVLVVVQNLASNIGGIVIRDDVTQQVVGIGAWPQTLDQIGSVQASFSDPIDIHTDSVVMSG